MTQTQSLVQGTQTHTSPDLFSGRSLVTYETKLYDKLLFVRFPQSIKLRYRKGCGGSNGKQNKSFVVHVDTSMKTYYNYDNGSTQD